MTPETTPTVERARAAGMLDGLAGTIPAVRAGLLYRLGLLLVAVVMVILPVVYLGMMSLVGYGLYLYATEGLSWARPRSLTSLVLYGAPLFAGGVLLFFTIKPLFARGPRQSEPRRLDPSREPLLFDFVRKVCLAVGAPEPREILVDCDVNASASLRRGMLGTLGFGGLTLTIGMPLVAGLSAGEFAGVLAHEFGHFAQRAGMRLTYVIRSVNGWFARVVYERDAWDENLLIWSREADVRLRPPLWAARLFVWITRKALWVLMIAGHVVSCFMLRLMEYDADRCEIALAGSEAFESTMRRLPVVSVAVQGASHDLEQFWSEGRLPDDYPGLVMSNVDRMPTDVRRQIEKAVAEERTGFLDTHPSAADRIARGREECAPGIFKGRGPATQLFRDFGELSRAASRDFYRQVLGRGAKRAAVVPLAELLSRQDAAADEQKALRRVLQGRPPVVVPLGLPPPDDLRGDAKGAVERVKTARAKVLAGAGSYRHKVAALERADTALVRTAQADVLNKAHVAFDPGELGEAAGECAPGGGPARELSAMRERLAGEVGSELAPARERTAAALALLPAVEWRNAAPLLGTVRRVEAAVPRMLDVRDGIAALSALFAHVEGNERNPALASAVRLHSGRVRKALREVQEALGDAPYPFDHARGPVSLRKFAVPAVPPVGEYGLCLEAGGSALDSLFTVYVRALGSLAAIVERVEAAHGLEPLPDPPEEEPEIPGEAGG
ncbi:MAG: M48 family metallopeptidase [Planctomycetota bacterium]|jgi:Zn-dependent protease with chaperone function